MGVFVGRIQYAPTADTTSKRDPFFCAPRWMTPKRAAFYSYPERSTPKFDPFPDSPPMGVFVGRIQYAPTAGATLKRDPFSDSSRWMTPKRGPFWDSLLWRVPKRGPFRVALSWICPKRGPFRFIRDIA